MPSRSVLTVVHVNPDKVVVGVEGVPAVVVALKQTKTSSSEFAAGEIEAVGYETLSTLS
jgi:hypothetical protein